MVVVGVLLPLLAAELLARAYLAHQQRARAAAWSAVEAGDLGPLRGDLTLGQIIRVSAHPGVVYELIPGLADVSFRGRPLEVNAQGFRGPSFPPEPEAGVLRIVGIGDSMMFGWGVKEERGFLRRLERMLRRSEPPIRAEAINLAVPGYNTAMEVAALAARGLAFHPHLVLLHFHSNDLSLPNFLPVGERNFFDMRHSFLLQDLLAPLWSGLDAEARGLAETPRELRLASEQDPERAPAKYRDMLGLPGFQRAMARLQQLAADHGFRVLVTAHREAPAFLHETCRAMGFSLLPIEPEISRYMAEHGIETYRGSELTLGYDPHPSPLQHRLIARAMRDYIIESGPEGIASPGDEQQADEPASPQQ